MKLHPVLRRILSPLAGRIPSLSVLSSGNLAVAVITFLRQMVIARSFGTSWQTDAYSVALLLPVILRDVIALTINATLIPNYSDVLFRKGPAAASALLSRVVNWILASTLILSLSLFLLSGPLSSLIGPGLSPEAGDLTSELLRILSPTIMLSALSGTLQGLCDSRRLYGLNALLRLGEVAVALAAVIVLDGPLGIHALPISMLAGSVAVAAVLLMASGRLRYGYRPLFDPSDPDFARMFRMALPVVAGASVVALAPISDKILGSFLAENSLTSLDYANRMMTVLFTVALAPVTTIAIVNLSEFAARSDLAAARTEVGKLLRITSALTLPGAAMLVLAAEPLVSVLFQRGLFTPDDTATVARAVRFYSPWLPAYGICGVLSICFYSLKDSKTPIIAALFSMVANILLNIILMSHLGIGGLALGTSLASAGMAVMLFQGLRRRIGGPDLPGLARSHAAIAAGTLLMAASVWSVMHLVPFDSSMPFPGRLLTLSAYLAAGILVYAAFMSLWRRRGVDSTAAGADTPGTPRGCGGIDRPHGGGGPEER
ncbi:MAG: lipid II flippase MurJ [Candidatus Fermentibacter sp.]|nr:lipid II flippase MurJ [Candidatus Fermentibacter sp.]